MIHWKASSGQQQQPQKLSSWFDACRSSTMLTPQNLSGQLNSSFIWLHISGVSLKQLMIEAENNPCNNPLACILTCTNDYPKLLANTWRQGSTAAIACNCSQSLAHHPFQRSRALHARGHLLQGMQQHVARHLQSCVSQTSSAFTSGFCLIGH